MARQPARSKTLRSSAAQPTPVTVSDEPTSRIVAETNDVLAVIGAAIRQLRAQKGMTLQALSTATILSASMLSLLERAKLWNGQRR